MKTLQEQYNLIKEGKGHKDVFTKEAKRLFPNIVPNGATFNQTAKLLKQRSVINENIFPLMPSTGLNPFTSFDKFINEEAKATESKTTKKVNEKEIAGYDYKDPKNLDNQIFDQYLNGLRVELEKDPELTVDKAKEVVAKNLEKDPIFYTKNAAFKVDGLGYTELEDGKEPTGKYKSSGYGDLKENKMSKSEDLKELLEEAVAGVPSLGNPFADRNKENYETKFEAFLSEGPGYNYESDPDAYKDPVEEKKEEVKEEEKEPKKEEMDPKMKKEEMKPKKEGRMKIAEVLKEAERLGEMAKKKVAMEVYKKAMSERKKACSINEDESLSEFINQEAIKEVKKEIAELEKKYMAAEADYNTMKK